MNKTVKFVPGAFAGLAAAVALVAGCKQEYPYLRTQEALATMDKVCGVYELVSLEWDGGPVDLNGDGTALPGLLEEALSGEFLGYTVGNLDHETGRITGTVYAPAYDPEKNGYNGSSGKYPGTEIMLPLFTGDYEEGTRWPYSLGAIHAYYRVEPSGELTLSYDREQQAGFHQGAEALHASALISRRIASTSGSSTGSPVTTGVNFGNSGSRSVSSQRQNTRAPAMKPRPDSAPTITTNAGNSSL